MMKWDIPDPQSSSDSGDDEDHHSDNMSGGDLMKNTEDGTFFDASETGTDVDRRPYRPIGDILGEMIAMIREGLDPYPGDLLYPPLSQTWFSVYRINDDFMRIEDQLQLTITNLPLEQARRHDFAPACWYAHRCALHTRYSMRCWQDTTPHLVMGDVLEREIMRNLQNGAPYQFDEAFPDVACLDGFMSALTPLTMTCS